MCRLRLQFVLIAILTILWCKAVAISAADSTTNTNSVTSAPSSTSSARPSTVSTSTPSTAASTPSTAASTPSTAASTPSTTTSTASTTTSTPSTSTSTISTSTSTASTTTSTASTTTSTPSTSTSTPSTSTSTASTTTSSTPETTNAKTTSTAPSTSTTSAVFPLGLPVCDNLPVMKNLNIDKLSGTWYEFARKGYGTYIQNLQCLQMNITNGKGAALVYQTYATQITDLSNQNTYKYVVQYDPKNQSHYYITSTDYDYLPIPIYKILETDYDTYLIVCSYIMQWQKAAAAFVYFRNRDTPTYDVYTAVNNAVTKYGDFQDLNLEYQGYQCSEASKGPTTAYILTVIVAIWAFFCHL